MMCVVTFVTSEPQTARADELTHIEHSENRMIIQVAWLLPSDFGQKSAFPTHLLLLLS